MPVSIRPTTTNGLCVHQRSKAYVLYAPPVMTASFRCALCLFPPGSYARASPLRLLVRTLSRSCSLSRCRGVLLARACCRSLALYVVAELCIISIQTLKKGILHEQQKNRDSQWRVRLCLVPLRRQIFSLSLKSNPRCTVLHCNQDIIIQGALKLLPPHVCVSVCLCVCVSLSIAL